MLNNRKIRTKLPQQFSRKDTPEEARVRRQHDEKKLDQKKHFDRRHRVKKKEVVPGDQILIKQSKTTTKPPFDPKPFTVTSVEGNRIDAQRDGKFRRRDKNSIKVVKARPNHLVPSWERERKQNVADYDEFDIEGEWMDASAQLRESGSWPEPRAVSLDEQDVTDDNEETEDDEPRAIVPVSEQDESSRIDGQHHDGNSQVTMMPYSPQPCRPRPLKKGDRVTFKGKEADDVEWFTCTLLSRAGRSKGRYTMAWNISRDGIVENVDFERDVGEFRLIDAEKPEEAQDSTRMNMDAHLAALIEAAIHREECPDEPI